MTDGLLMKLKYIRERSVPLKGAQDGDGKEGEMGKRCMINIASSSRSCLFLALETRSQLFQCPFKTICLKSRLFVLKCKETLYQPRTVIILHDAGTSDKIN